MPYLTPDAPTVNKVIRLRVPDTLVPTVTGALVSIWEAYKWEKFGTLEVNDVVGYIGQIVETLEVGPNISYSPTRVIVPVAVYSAYLTTPSRVVQPASVWGLNVFSGNFNPNWIEWSAAIPPGRWRIDTWSNKQSNNGITSILVDGVEVGTFDGYSAVSTWDNYRQTPAFDLAGEVPHAIRFSSTSKNAAANGYIQSVSHMELVSAE